MKLILEDVNRLGSELKDRLADGLALGLYFRGEFRASCGIAGFAGFKPVRRALLFFSCFGKRIAADRIAPDRVMRIKPSIKQSNQPRRYDVRQWLLNNLNLRFCQCGSTVRTAPTSLSSHDYEFRPLLFRAKKTFHYREDRGNQPSEE